MKTAFELADDADLLAVGLELALQDSNAADVRRYAAMLRQQAEQIKKLQRNLSEETENVKSFLSKCQSLEIERDALKADAERLDLLEKTRAAYGFEDIHEGNTWYVEGPFNNVRAAIDAMKGKSWHQSTK